MKSFRIGYILTLGFLLVLMVVTLTFGYFPPPTGPKAPEYPTYSNYSSLTLNSTDEQRKLIDSQYQQEQRKYQDDLKKYQDGQKNFLGEKIVPYAQKVFTVWMICLIVFEVLGLIFVKFLSPIAGAAYAFSGVWAVIFGPIGGLLWFVNSLVSGLGARAERQFTADPIFQSVGIATLVGVVILTFFGIFFFGKIREQAA